MAPTLLARLGTDWLRKGTDRGTVPPLSDSSGRDAVGSAAMAATDDASTRAKLERLEALRERARHAGSENAVEKQRSAGKLLARERAERLCDPGSFVELDRYVRHREPNFGMLDRRPYGDAVV